jgi:hypothetical protein
MFAVIATTPRGTDMIASVHETEDDAITAWHAKLNSPQSKFWKFSIETVADDAVPHPVAV